MTPKKREEARKKDITKKNDRKKERKKSQEYRPRIDGILKAKK